MHRAFFALAVLAASTTPAFAQPHTIYYGDFSNATAFTFNGVATTAIGTTGKQVLRLVPSEGGEAGAAYLTIPIVPGSKGAFKTEFQFQDHDGPSNGNWSDGITFVVTTTPNDLGTTNQTGGDLGYSGDPHSLAIAFPTFAYNQYVGAVANGNLNTLGGTPVNASGWPYGAGNCITNGPQRPLCIGDGDIWTANITYDGTYLNVTVEDGSNPVSSVVTNYKVKIAANFKTKPIYVGFTGGTGGGYADWDILNWQMQY